MDARSIEKVCECRNWSGLGDWKPARKAGWRNWKRHGQSGGRGIRQRSSVKIRFKTTCTVTRPTRSWHVWV